jgi:CxxC motif-containing protein
MERKRGNLMNRMMICIMCPLGCRMEIQVEKEEIRQIQGNECKEGVQYAKKEIFFPGRVLTTTIKTANPDIPLLPVRSDREIPKGRLIDCMKEIAKHKVMGPVKIGETVIRDILGLGINMNACHPISKNKVK